MRKIVLMSVAVVLIVIVGCQGLTPEQQAAVNETQATLADAELRIATYAEQIAAIQAAVEAGEMPSAEGFTLVAEIAANYTKDKALVETLHANITDLKDTGTPWYLIAGLVLTPVLGGAAVYFPWLKPAQLLLSTVISGVESSRRSASTKKSIAKTAAAAGIEGKLNALVKKVTEGK